MLTALMLQFLLLADAQASLRFSTTEIRLPGAEAAVSLDYFAAERAAGRVWIPAGNTGSVDVLDVANHTVRRIEGFAVATRASHGNMRSVGPSAVSLGDGMAFIGNRATAQICTVDAQKLAKLACVTLTAASDGVQYVAATKEVWVTTPGDRSVTVVDVGNASRPRQAARIPIAGVPEGYAVDEARGRFFTNLEDKDKTLAIDVRSRKVVQTWNAHCGQDGPRGLAYDPAQQLLFVACTDRVEVLDPAHDGKLLSALPTGAGVDNIDYLASQRTLYVAAGKAARLTVAHVENYGRLVSLGSTPTAPGGRVVVVTADGTAVVGDPTHGGVLVLTPRP